MGSGFSAMVTIAIFPIATSGWWASMCTASCLCRDEVIEVICAARATDRHAVHDDPQGL